MKSLDSWSDLPQDPPLMVDSWMGDWLGSVGIQSHSVIFYLSPAKVCSPAIIETYFSVKDIWIAVTDYCIHQMHPVDTLA